MIYLKAIRFKNHLLFSAAIFCGFAVVRGANAQDADSGIVAQSAEGPGADGLSANVSDTGNDLTQTPSYQHYFGKNAAPPPSAPILDPDDPRNGPTYKKYFAPVADRSPRIRKPRRRSFGGPRASGREHFGVSGHRRHHEDDFEVSHNAETVIGRQTLEHFAAGTNALQALAMSTPGANFSSSDPLGLDAANNLFYLRGYSQEQLGFTMDGIPMGEQGFGSSYGVDVNQIEIQDNIAGVAASQGAGGLDTPSITTLGGTVKYTTIGPSDKFGVKINQEFGSFDAYRTVGRLDSGILNRTGTKFMASFMRNSQNLWQDSIDQPWGTRGRGYQREETMNFKLVQPISHFGKIAVTSDWADTPQYNAANVNPGMARHLPYGVSNFYPNYGAANRWGAAASNGELPAGATPCKTENQRNCQTPEDIANLIYSGAQVERTYLEALNADFQISRAITSSTVVYGQVSDNRMGSTNLGWPSPATGQGSAPGGNENMNWSDQHLKGRRIGVTQNFAFQLGHRHTLKTGVWYENNRYNQPTFFYGDGGGESAMDGNGYAISNDFGLKDKNGFQAFKERFTTNTFQFYIEDGFHMAKNMNFTYGFKSLVSSTNGGMIDRADGNALVDWTGVNMGPTYNPKTGMTTGNWRPYYGRVTSSNAFLPHFNYDWKFMPKHEFYFDVAENMSPLTQIGGKSQGTKANYDSAQLAFDQEKKNLRGMRTWNYVVGYRYDSKPFGVAMDYYHTDYLNRPSTVSMSSSGGATASQTAGSRYINLGQEKMDGADLNLIAHLSNIFRMPSTLGKLDFTNSFSYNHAVYENSAVPDGAGFVSIKGVQQVLYPRYMWKTNVNYTNGRLGWNLNVNYNSKQNMTYTGDVKNPGYWTSVFTGYINLGPRGKESNAKLTFNVSNLFGQHYTVAGYSNTALCGSASGSCFENGARAKVDKDGMSPTLTWAAPREFFGALQVAF